MAVKNDDGVPLYIHTIFRILREMRIIQQDSGGKFDYVEFKSQLMASGLSPAQLGPLLQRMNTLESFMPKSQVEQKHKTNFKIKGKGRTQNKSTWSLEV